jgi:hypothetical protein
MLAASNPFSRNIDLAAQMIRSRRSALGNVRKAAGLFLAIGAPTEIYGKAYLNLTDKLNYYIIPSVGRQPLNIGGT